MNNAFLLAAVIGLTCNVITVLISKRVARLLTPWLVTLILLDCAWWAMSGAARPIAMLSQRSPNWIAYSIVGVLFAAVGVFTLHTARSLVEKAEPPPVVSKPLPEGTIEISYDVDMLGLPLAVQPNTSVTIIQVLSRTKVEAQTVKNSQREPTYWPKEKQTFPPQGVGIIEVANHGTEPVFNLAASVRFDIGAQKSEGGVSSVQFRLPLMPRLRPVDAPYRFYVADKSGLGGLVFLPEIAVADIPDIGRREIRVTTRKLTFFDNIPMLPMTFPEPSKKAPPKKGGR